MSGIIKIERVDGEWFQAIKKPFNNKKLSFAARGLLAYLLSKPPNWETRNTDLIKASPGGKTALQTILKELKKTGHLKRTRLRDENNRFAGWSTVIYEEAQEFPDIPIMRPSGNPDIPIMRPSGNSAVERPDNREPGSYNNIDSTNKEINKKKKRKEQQQQSARGAPNSSCGAVVVVPFPYSTKEFILDYYIKDNMGTGDKHKKIIRDNLIQLNSLTKEGWNVYDIIKSIDNMFEQETVIRNVYAYVKDVLVTWQKKDELRSTPFIQAKSELPHVLEIINVLSSTPSLFLSYLKAPSDLSKTQREALGEYLTPLTGNFSSRDLNLWTRADVDTFISLIPETQPDLWKHNVTIRSNIQLLTYLLELSRSETQEFF